MAEVGVRRFRPTIAATLALALCALIGGVAASQAQAGTYTARFCTEGAGGNAGGDKGPFERFGNETTYALGNACGGFNGLRVSHVSGQEGADGSFGRWLAERPEGIAVTQVAYRARGSDQSAGYVAQVVGSTAGTGLGIIKGGQELDGSFKDFTTTGDVRRFGIQLLCQTDAPTCGSPSGQEAGLKNVTYTLEDSSAPGVAIRGGTLFEGAAQIGSQSIAYEALDAGSGVARVIAVVNGEDAAAVGGKCNAGGGAALGFKPCSASLSGSLAVDTAAEPWRVGRNKVQLCVEDYSSDSRRCTDTTRVLALNGCATNSTPAQTMELAWPGKKGVVQSRQGRSRKAIAQVFGGGRTPLAGGSVCFSRGIPTDKTGAERVLEGAAVTGAKGRASVKVRGKTSRWVRATWFGGAEDVVTERIKLNVSPAIKLGLRPQGKVEVGEKVRVVGVLRGKYQNGRKVCFFAGQNNPKKFACDTSGEGGRAKASFKTKDAGKLRFYAKVPNQRDYPYVNGRSKSKRKRVVP